MDDDDGRPLTDAEARQVFRRASEIDVILFRRAEGWDIEQLEAVGAEAGISPEAVRRAVADVRLASAGADTSADADLHGAVVRRARVVEASPATVMAELSSWLRDQLLAPVREQPSFAVFDRRGDEEAVRRRARDTGGRYTLSAVRRLDVAVAGLPGAGTAVRVGAALSATKRQRALSFGARITSLVWLCALGAAGASDTIGVGDVALATPVIVAGCGQVAWRRATQLDRDERREVGLALDGALDRLDRS